jgi:hypothetical protein
VTQNLNRANGAVSEPGFFNTNHGAEVQLRGLGVGTTLMLVNGQRQGASGWQGFDAVCKKPSINGENCNQPIAVIIDGRFRNIASLKTRGVDTVLDYFLTRRGAR